ncbi:unnamed protein product, partial [Laminaria digitata]
AWKKRRERVKKGEKRGIYMHVSVSTAHLRVRRLQELLLFNVPSVQKCIGDFGILRCILCRFSCFLNRGFTSGSPGSRGGPTTGVFQISAHWRCLKPPAAA